jgi:hypothetical protein
MVRFLKKVNSWFRTIMLDDVDKEHDGPLPYHKKFGSTKNPVDRIQKRFDEQKAQNRG